MRWKRQFELRPALPQDADAGSVWLTLSSDVPQRSIVKITGPTGETVFCEALGIDKNFINGYNRVREEDFPELRLDDLQYDAFGRALPDGSGKGILFASEYYRTRLGRLEARRLHSLTISTANHWWDRIRACLHHPQVGIRLATQLGLWGLGLGIVAILLGAVGVGLGIVAINH